MFDFSLVKKNSSFILRTVSQSLIFNFFFVWLKRLRKRLIGDKGIPANGI